MKRDTEKSCQVEKRMPIYLTEYVTHIYLIYAWLILYMFIHLYQAHFIYRLGYIWKSRHARLSGRWTFSLCLSCHIPYVVDFPLFAVLLHKDQVSASFSKLLLSEYCVLDTVLGPWNINMYKAGFLNNTSDNWLCGGVIETKRANFRHPLFKK